MKVFLMHPDQDFDPARELPSHAEALVRDLALNTLFEAMAGEDKFLFGVAKQAVLSSLSDLETIRYRQEVLKDCLKHPVVVRALYHIPLESIERKQKRWLGIRRTHPGAVLSSGLELLNMFVALLKDLKRIADEHAGQFESEGFRRFFAMIQRELDDAYFSAVKTHLQMLSFHSGVWLSAELGKGNEGTNYTLRKAKQGDSNWIKRLFSRRSPDYSFTLHPRDEAGAQALENLRDRGINLVANAVGQSADHIDSFFSALRLELAFYIGCLNLSERLAELGEPLAFPQPAPVSQRRHSFTGLYDVCLALTMRQKVVGNEANADSKNLVVITGANQGGKSTFLRSVGLAQLMMQCGMFVPATSFRANVCTALFTHYKREEDSAMKSGKFDEELGRMSAIVDAIAPGALVLFNESFAATNEHEGSEIARQIVTALLESGIKVFFVTHLYEFAHRFFERAADTGFFLRAERNAHQNRTFKVIEAKPLPTSYGPDLYHKIFTADD